MRVRTWGAAPALMAAAVGVVAVTAGEEPSAEYAAAMRTLEAAARGLGEGLDARDHAVMNEHIIRARPAIDLVQQYWRQRAGSDGDQVEDAVDAIRAVSKSVSEISVAVHLMSLSPNPLAVEGAELALTNLHAACTTCHEAYRAEQPDGGYLIK